MKKNILLSMALAVSAATAPAAPLDPKGIPADAGGIIHIDLELCAKSATGAAIRQFSEKALLEKNSGRDDYERFKKQTGIDPEKDISSITIGLFNAANGSRTPSAVAVARGKFSPEKIIGAAKKSNCAVTTRGALTLIDLSSQAFSPLNLQAEFAGIVDKNTILLGETAGIVEKAAAALSGSAGSYASPATLDVFGRQEGDAMILAYFARGLVEEGAAMIPVSKAESILFSLGEKGPNLHARIYSEYASPEAARKTQAGVQMLIGFMQMGAANSESPDAEENIQNLQRLIDSLKINLRGKCLDITADYPVAAVVEQIKKHTDRE